MKNKKVLIWTIVVAVAMGAFFLIRSLTGTSTAKGPGAGPSPGGPGGVKAGPVSVRGIVVQPSSFDESITLTGSIMANESVEIRSEVSGRIIKLGFQEGGLVRKGQLLVKLFDADLRAQLAKARQQLKIDEDKMRRYAELKRVDGVSTEEYEVAAAQVEMRKAEIDVLLAQISRTEILAPFSGRIGLRQVSDGAVITTNTLIAVLADEQQLKLECSIPERYASTVALGKSLSFRTRGRDTMQGREAVIYAIDPAVEASTRTLKIRARCKDSRGLVAGMFADINLPLATVNDALLVPTEAIVPDLNGTKIFVQRGGVARPVFVETGGRTPTMVRISSGIAAGDTVLTTGLLLLKPGLPVKTEL